MSDNTRRLPVYLLLDCSGSMLGEPIEAVRQGVRALLLDLKGDPQALETVYISVITFDSAARQVVPLTELLRFRMPEICAGGTTAMGGALEVLMDCVNREVRKPDGTQKGDWRPLVFLLTDGKPTDGETFARAAGALRNLQAANIIACAAGAKAETDCLKQITGNVLIMNTLSAGDLARFFAWASGSIRTAAGGNAGDGMLPPPPPPGFVTVL